MYFTAETLAFQRPGRPQWYDVLRRVAPHLVIDEQKVWKPHQQGDRLEVAGDVEIELGVEEGIDGDRTDRAHQQRVAVGRRLRHKAGADAASGAGFILDYEWNPEFRLQVLLQDAREQVRRSARRERHHDGDRSLRPSLLRMRQCCQRNDGANGEGRENSTHANPPAVKPGFTPP